MAGTVNKPGKPNSKRKPTRLRNKIQKASLAKQRKERKQAKKNPEWRSKLKKDPGIPNLFPYKEKLLEEIEERKLKKAAEAQRRKEMVKAAKTGVTKDGDEEILEDVAEGDDVEAEEDEDMDMEVDESNPMAALIASARRAAEDYDRKLADDDVMEDESSDEEENEDNRVTAGQASSRKTYDKVFKSVVEQADVVLYVLDARDPEGTRSRDVERSVMAAASGGKRLILVINKVDLVPPKVLRDWLVYLRRYFPTLPLCASNAAPNAHTFNHRDLTISSTSTALFKALKSFAASRQLKRAVSVGVIGYPNVGKSSVINALLSRMGGKGASAARACPAGAEAGVTTSIRQVKIDSKLTLLDSPGVVFPSSTGSLVSVKNATEAHANLVLLNAVPPKQIDDPIPAVNLLLKRLSATPDLVQKLLKVYDIAALMPNQADGDVTTDFLVQVARKRGRLGRGGVPNLGAAAMAVVTDWRDGRIQGWVEPPVLPVESSAEAAAKPVDKVVSGEEVSAADQKQIVTEWAAEFKLDGLWGDDALKADDAMEQ
ncbi:P-loop containing nucleoside triphosphate hydrolase protein [Emericellopsis atlantica]|uniref:P-loop containing nucleoside triphosphate hydrolase protein n=1 Tax=Emericellopsis atlantica TaxID=2614577 RepID=A0A9P8CQ13_9HYPO|nr:P-loop containing nucleoside triphosphate hydrolase protein [Emericellopsis atlantica]KAG9255148.1 P-loop containing nucleoside triphosphate hydrolase protein [Emericellopsis atlantica]